MTSEENLDRIMESDSMNGLILLDVFLPEEIISNILQFLSWEDLLNSRLVCCSWKRLIDSFVSFEKMKACKNYEFFFSFSMRKFNPKSIPFYVYYAMGKNVFGKNHLKNAFGAGDVPHICQHPRQSFRRRRRISRNLEICSDANCPRFKHWNVINSLGDGWTVETVPVGSEQLPQHLEGRSCFVTSYAECFKQQCITLAECGLTSKIMDEVRPHIEVSEWYAKRFDCGIVYKLNVSLLDANQEIVQLFSKEITDDHGDNGWHQVSHTFKHYNPGVRYVLFEHKGQDTQFWAGHYGSKMAGGSVIARIPEQFLQPDDEYFEDMITTD